LPLKDITNNPKLPPQGFHDTNKNSPSKKHKGSVNNPLMNQPKLNKNVSQSQEQKMEIEEFIPENMIGSLSTQDSQNNQSLNSLNINLKNLNCANSHIISNSNKNIFSLEEQKIPEENNPPMEEEIIPNPKTQDPIPPPIVQIPVPNPIMKQLAEERKEMMKHKEENIFNFEFSSDAEYISNVGEYINDIYSNLLQDEKDLKIKPNFGYMDQQNDINYHMRAILIDWIVDVHSKYQFKEQTLYQTVWIIDTYLTLKNVLKTKLQLVGVAALFIACKNNEIYYPQTYEFIEIVDKAYALKELIEMENNILKELKFNIISPTSCDFYNIISKAYNFDRKQFLLGKYFLESSLIDYHLLRYSPSVIGISCVYIVMKFFGFENYRELYSKKMVNEKQPQKVIKDAARDICFLVRNLHTSHLTAVKNKYSLPENLNVAFYCDNAE